MDLSKQSGGKNYLVCRENEYALTAGMDEERRRAKAARISVELDHENQY